MTKKTFSITSRLKSFKYAFEGIRDFFRTEHNAWIHLLATIGVIVLAVSVPVSRTEIMALVFAVGIVWVAELFNTAIEKIADFVCAEQDPKIKFIKDLSAAAVLISAITALVIGCIVFIPKF
jgi:diacylglycerol kinase